MTRRTNAQIQADRAALVALFHADGGRYQLTAVEAEALTGNRNAAADLAALAKAGRLVRSVEIRWDRQAGYAANLFGGAGVMRRRVATYRLPADEWAAIREAAALA